MRGYAFALMFAACAAQAEPALTNRATDVLAQPQSDAGKLASLAENDKVEVLRRSGAWSQVKTGAGQAGWVRMMHLKPVSAGAGSGGAAQGPGGALANLLGSGRSANNATVTTGVRGLQEEDLQKAQANPDEFRKMQKYAASRDAGQAFARRNKLDAAQVDYLQEQERSAPASGDSAMPGMTGG